MNLARQLSRSLDPRHDYEPHACYNSFCKHWQQAYDIILKLQPQHLHDDVLAVVNHLEQLATLLVLEARAREINSSSSPAACLEYLLSENVLDKLYEWAIMTGKYESAVRLEELKLFGNLISYYSTQVIAAEPFLRPLLKLLSSFRNELPPPGLESQLVTVLNQLCVTLMQNMKFIDLFFLTTHTQNGSHAEFIIVRLLLPSVHREGSTGSTARDALLLCAKMSARCTQLADFMLSGNACPVLATGLSGLYSLLPRTLDEKVYRLTPDDVNQVHKLILFIDSLEFCNAVAQVAHPSITKHLLDLLYQGFLVPVLGPALLQSGAGEQAAATAYLELVLRCVSQRGLLRPVLHFLFAYHYDGVRLVDVLLARMDGTSQLSLVSVALMETLIDLNCEDVMIDLVYRYLLNGHHLLALHRDKISDPEPYRDAAVAFQGLTPRCCMRPLEMTRQWVDDLALSGRRILEFRIQDERRVNGVNEDIAMNNLVQEFRFNYGNPNETLFGNYHAYLCDSRFEIVSRTLACSNWTSRYDVISPKRETNNNIKETKEIENQTPVREDSLISICTSEYDTLKTSESSEKEHHSLSSLNENVESDAKLTSNENHVDGKEHDSLISFGDSSDYESYKYKGDDDEGYAEDLFRKSFVDEVQCEREFEPPRSWKASAESIVGPLISGLLKKAASLLEADLVVNCRVTNIITKLASLPSPLLTSLLLCPSSVLPPNVPSLFQILKNLKEEVDALTDGLDNTGELVDKARVFLIQREMALVKSRAQTSDDSKAHNLSLPTNKPEDSPFRRMEAKRRSLSNSISSMFGRRLSSSSPSSHSPNSLHNHTPSPQKRLIFTQEAYWNQSVTLRSILNAVILDEWSKELSSLCEEHALRLSCENYEDDTYIRTVAL